MKNSEAREKKQVHVGIKEAHIHGENGVFKGSDKQ